MVQLTIPSAKGKSFSDKIKVIRQQTITGHFNHCVPTSWSGHLEFCYLQGLVYIGCFYCYYTHSEIEGYLFGIFPVLEIGSFSAIFQY